MKIVFAGIVLVLMTQQPPPAPPAAGPPTAQPQTPAQKPVIPVAATVLAANTDRYVGNPVSLTAAVDQPYGATAFSIKRTDMLVLAPVLTAPVKPGDYVTVIGEVVRFDLGTIAARMKDAMPSLAADVVEKYRGRPAIVATSVINAAMTDLAKRPPPPMSPEEAAYSKLMKQIGPGFTALRQAANGSNAADAAAQAAILKKAFGETQGFWKAKARPDALQWADDARKLAEEIETSAGAGNIDAVKAAVPKLQQVCGSCHTQYRERLDDGSYRYKAPK